MYEKSILEYKGDYKYGIFNGVRFYGVNLIGFNGYWNNMGKDGSKQVSRIAEGNKKSLSYEMGFFVSINTFNR